jgi:plasmid stability protein
MSTTTLTIRTTEQLRQALTKRAEAEHKSVSEVVREILEAALIERPLSERVGKLRGGLRLPEPNRGWQNQIRDRNWRE